MNRDRKTFALLDDEPELEKLPQNNFAYLLVALLLLICLTPSAQLLSSGRIAFSLLFLVLAGSIVIASWSFRANRRLIWFGISFSAIATLLSILAAVIHSKPLAYWSLVAHIMFWSTGVWIVGGQVLAAGRIDFNRIVGAVCVYLMVAVIFAFLNTLTNWLVPGSFSNLAATGLTEELSEFIYYSFVTLNTLGYGDISPIGRTARVLAIVESTFGVFYLAILVASLVSMHIAHRVTADRGEPPADPAAVDEDPSDRQE